MTSVFTYQEVADEKDLMVYGAVVSSAEKNLIFQLVYKIIGVEEGGNNLKT